MIKFRDVSRVTTHPFQICYEVSFGVITSERDPKRG